MNVSTLKKYFPNFLIIIVFFSAVYFVYTIFSDTQKRNAARKCSEEIVSEIGAIQNRTVVVTFVNGKTAKLYVPTVSTLKKGDRYMYCTYPDD